MDNGSCHLVYYDSRAHQDCVVIDPPVTYDATVTYGSKNLTPEGELSQNLSAFLGVFTRVHLCRTARSCLSKIEEFEKSHSSSQTVVVVFVSSNEQITSKPHRQRTPSPLPRTLQNSNTPTEDDANGVELISYLSNEKRLHKAFENVSAVALLCADAKDDGLSGDGSSSHSTPQRKPQPPHWTKLLDAGAVDVMSSPLTSARVESLPAHAYRTTTESTRRHSMFRPTSPRRTSWVGVNDVQPYAYLREAMVSGLMDRICDPDHISHTIDPSQFHVAKDRQDAVADAVGRWSFSAHEFSDDEMLYGAFVIFRHTLKLPGLDKWRLSDESLTTFLLACRQVYNNFVIYHNFRHACDVLQAVFFFLISIGTIPPIHPPANSESYQKAPVAKILEPFHAFALVISAIGHDVGHPGVNNLFLVTLNAPLAQLYNDRSVLESFHCAAFSQVLRRYWPSAFSDVQLRKLMINSILSTDMGLHSQYIAGLSELREKMASDGRALEGLTDKQLDDYRELLCCLLLKCADICNVARDFSISNKWANILTNEFSHQGVMEHELEMPTCLFGGPPDLDDLFKLGNSQIGFMNIFAGPLFDSMSQILPDMGFTIKQINRNKDLWEQTIEAERKRIEQQNTQKGSTGTQPDTGSSDNYRSDSEQMSHPNQPPGLTHDSSHKSSATSDTPQFTSASSSRRASLGPTVLSNNKTVHTEGSGRSSGGSPRDFPEMQGLSEAISDQLQLDGTHSLGGNLKAQTNGPTKTDIHGHDALNHVNMSAPNVNIPRQHQTRDLKSPSAADLPRPRGFNKKANWATQTYPAGDAPNPRKTKRKFSLRFWRKTDNEVR